MRVFVLSCTQNLYDKMDETVHNSTQLAAVPANFVRQANTLHAEISGALRSALLKARELGLILTAIKGAVPLT